MQQKQEPLASRLIFGTMTFGQRVSEQRDADRLIDTCLEFGIRRFDTSNNYSGGRSERMLGAALARHSIPTTVSTKVGSTVDQDDPDLRGLRPEAIRNALTGSLERLGRASLDVYYLHRPDRSTPIEETLHAMAELVAEGLIGAVGQSNFAAWQITQMWMLAAAQGWPLPEHSQQLYNLLGRRVEAEYLECASVLGLKTHAYNPLAGGLLTGKHISGLSTGGRFSKLIYQERYLRPELLAAVERLSQVAEDAGFSLTTLSLRWLLTRPGVDSVLIGASSHSQLLENLASIDDAPLSEEVVASCDEIWAGLAGAAPAYNR